MKRIKQVFKSSEVAHVWAQQKQDEGRTSRGNLYFEGRTIYSYGSHFPIASFVAPGVVLLTTKGYSPTTSGHIHKVKDAISNLKVFYAPNVPRYFGDSMGYDTGAHNDNVKHFLKEFPARQKEAVKARKYGPDIQHSLKNSIKETAEYVAFFKKMIDKKLRDEVKQWERKLSANKLFSEKETAQIKATIKIETAQATIRNAERRALEAARVAERIRSQAENLERWLTGESISSYNLPNDSLRLRIKDKAIETTRGASVPLIEARKLWNMLVRKENVVGMRLGHYTVDSLDGSIMTVGCHQIPLREVYRMAKALKWDSPTLEVA